MYMGCIFCCILLLSTYFVVLFTYPLSETVKPCWRHFHGTCWPETLPNVTVTLPCPEMFFDPSGKLTRVKWPFLMKPIVYFANNQIYLSFLSRVRSARVIIVTGWKNPRPGVIYIYTTWAAVNGRECCI